MAKKKKRVKSASTRAGGTIPKRKQDRNWLLPMLVGGASVFALFVGVPWLLGLVFPDAPGVRTRHTVKVPETASKSDSRSSLDREPPPPRTRKPPTTTGTADPFLKSLEEAAVAERFAGDAKLAGEFSDLAGNLASGKSPMIVRRKLEALLPKVEDNPGREPVLMALAQTQLKTRAETQAGKSLDSLLKEFPNSEYAGMARAMKLEAVYRTASGKGQTASQSTLDHVYAQAEELASREDDPNVRAYMLYVGAMALDRGGKEADAIEVYGALADQYPDTPYAPKSLSAVANEYTARGDTQAAIASLERLIQHYPRDKSARRAKQTLRQLKLVGTPASELVVEDWASGGPTSLSDLRGKVVLLAFWKTWCPHCKEEWPHLAEMYNQYKDQGLVVIGLTTNGKRQNETQLAKFLEEHPAPFPVARVNSSTQSKYAVTGYPSAALVDKNGVIRWRAHPGTLSPTLLEELLEE